MTHFIPFHLLLSMTARPPEEETGWVNYLRQDLFMMHSECFTALLFLYDDPEFFVMREFLPLILSILFIGLVTSCGSPNADPAQRVHHSLSGEIPEHAVAYIVQPFSSKMAWMARKITGQHYGTLEVKGGEIFVMENVLVGGNVEIDMQKLRVLDVTDPEVNQRLTNHLRSGDFFAVDVFPVASFRFLFFEKLIETDEEGNNYKITGDLSIKEITHSVAFNAFIEYDQETIYATADFDLDRTLWDIRYRSGRFFDQLGDNMIYDLFNVKLEVIARKQLLSEGDKKRAQHIR